MALDPIGTSLSECPLPIEMTRWTMRLATITFLLLASVATRASEKQVELEEHFRSYMASWTHDVDIDEVVRTYWHPQASIFSPGSTVQLRDRDAIAGALSAAMQPVIDAGWLRSEMLSFSSCTMRDGMSLAGVVYRRHFEDGHATTDGAIYVVERRDGRWWIAAVMGSDSARIQC